MDSLANIQQKQTDTQAPLSPRSMEQIVESFKSGQHIDQKSAVTVLAYFNEHPLTQDSGNPISNITLEQVEHLYASLPTLFADGRDKLTEMVRLLRQIIKGTAGIDFDQWQKSSEPNEFADYLAEVIIEGAKKYRLSAYSAFVDCFFGIYALQSERRHFVQCVRDVGETCHDGVCEYKYALALYNNSNINSIGCTDNLINKTLAFKYMTSAASLGYEPALRKLIEFKRAHPDDVMIPDELQVKWAYSVFKEHMEKGEITSALSLLKDTYDAVLSDATKGQLIFLYAMLQQKSGNRDYTNFIQRACEHGY